MSIIMSLSSEEISRYIRQINLPQVGIEGQAKLKKARVLCIGAGGLGTPLLLYLASAGVGTLGIIDDDCVEISNLPRQVLYHDQHIGKQKTEVLKSQLMAINSHIKVDNYSDRFTAHQAELIHQYDIITDCTDNFATRYLINDFCFKWGKPYVFASVQQFEGQCATFLGTCGPCYRCLFSSIPAQNIIPDCNMAGILGVLPGLFGIIQATEIIKWILQKGDLLVGRLFTMDLLKMQCREFKLPQNPDCDVCGQYRMIRPVPIQHQQAEKLSMNEYVIDPRDLRRALENKEDIQLVDVRTLEKHEAFNIGGSLIPLDELSNRLGELDPHKPVVTYCTSGGKSMLALKLLLSAGFKSVKSLNGGMTAWRNNE